MALLHSFEFGPAIEGFNATLKADPGCAMAHWGIAMARWTNPFSLDGPAAGSRCSRASTRSRRRRQAGAKTEREKRLHRGGREALHGRGDARPADARRRLRKGDGARSPPPIRRIARRRSSGRSSLTASALPADKTYANQLKAGAILEKLYPQAARSSGHHALHHSQLRRAGAGRQGDRGRAPLRQDRARRRRTRCTCRRTRSRASAPGRTRSTPIIASAEAARKANARARRAARHGLHGLRLSPDRPGQGRAGDLLDSIPEIAAAFDPDGDSRARPRDRPASSRSRRFPRAGCSNIATGRRPRVSTAEQLSRSRTPRR